MSYRDSIEETGAPAREKSLIAVYWALASVFILTLIKAAAYYYGGSAAMLASLTDTLGDGLISLVTLLSLRISLKPADEDHRHGHGKAEGFSALLQGSFLMGAAAFLLFDSFERFFRPVEIGHHFLGIGVSAVAVVLSIIVVKVQKRCLEHVQSLAIEADQRHYANDILINGAVIIGLLVHYYTGVLWVDTALGVVIACYLGWTGYDIGHKATNMLMDREIGEEERARITQIVNQNKEVRGMHDLRTRRMGMDVHISFDVELDPQLSLHDAHAITRELEFALLGEFPNAEIIIHMDPEGDPYDTRHKVQGVHH